MKCLSPLALLALAVALTPMRAQSTDQAWDSPHTGNPILPGYYADPSLVQHEGKYYLYATLDPWGGDTLGCWESSDFKNWTYRILNWPTKKACTSSTSRGSMVWAPSVVRGKDGKFYMYVSVGNEVWVGGADSPLGPWRNLLGDRPLIPANFRPGFHMIDAEAFLDSDGSAYLYWGSGLNWKDGHCFVVKLKADQATFEGEPQDVTPKNYFEGPFMLKHGGRYYLTYSNGNTTREDYRVHYAVGDTPFGPFTEASNSPILVTNKPNHIISPGHHAVFTKDGQSYILYHRHDIPKDPKRTLRQACLEPLHFTADGLIEKVTPTHQGPALVQGRAESRSLAAGAAVTASSQADDAHGPARVLDDNYATRWAAAKEAQGGWVQLDLGSRKQITRQEVRPEYAWKPYLFAVEASDDGQTWKTLADYTQAPVSGSPILIEKSIATRYLRLTFPERSKGADISLFEWAIY